MYQEFAQNPPPRTAQIPEALLATVHASPDPSKVFAMSVAGDCLEPEIMDGGMVFVCPSSEVEAGDFVCIFFRDDRAPTVERLVREPKLGVPISPRSEISELIEVQQLNPVKYFAVGSLDIEAMHKVIGWDDAPADEKGELIWN